MPKRVIDFDALWASDKIASCPGWAQAEYAWLYGLADASGSFELTNLRVIWGRVAAVRKDLTLERLEEIFQEFMARGLLFTWGAGGKRYGHWTGSDVPGRLPAPSWRARLERLAPPVPRQELAAYASRFSSRREAAWSEEAATQTTGAAAQSVAGPSCAALGSSGPSSDEATAEGCGGNSQGDSPQLKLGLEAPQGQEWDRDWEKEEGRENTPGRVLTSPLSVREKSKADGGSGTPESKAVCADQLLEIYEQERGSLPAALGLTAERRRHCLQRIRAGLQREDFRMAVRRAAATPFLAGEGARGWRASFDWLVANDTNIRKVIEGMYDAAQTRAAAQGGPGARAVDRALSSELHVGTGPVAADYGVRINPRALERIRAREAARGS